MGGLFILAVVVLIVVALVGFIAAQKGRGPASAAEEPTFDACKELFTPAERSFFGVLEQAVAGQFKVFGKVRLGDLIQPAKGLTQSRRTGLRNSIQQKHVDFVLCRPDTLEVAGVVELDDASHGRKDRADRDDLVDKALGSAGIPILHFPVRKGYVVAELQEALAAPLGLKAGAVAEKSAEPVKLAQPWTAPEPAPTVTAARPVSAVADAPVAGIPPAADKGGAAEAPSAPSCPACNIPMVKRQAKKGPNAGQWFWACSEYPKCRKVLAVG